MEYSPEFIKFRDQHCAGMDLGDIRIIFRMLYEIYRLEEEMRIKDPSIGDHSEIDNFFSRMLEEK